MKILHSIKEFFIICVFGKQKSKPSTRLLQDMLEMAFRLKLQKVRFDMNIGMKKIDVKSIDSIKH